MSKITLARIADHATERREIGARLSAFVALAAEDVPASWSPPPGEVELIERQEARLRAEAAEQKDSVPVNVSPKQAAEDLRRRVDAACELTPKQRRHLLTLPMPQGWVFLWRGVIRHSENTE